MNCLIKILDHGQEDFVVKLNHLQIHSKTERIILQRLHCHALHADSRNIICSIQKVIPDWEDWGILELGDQPAKRGQERINLPIRSFLKVDILNQSTFTWIAI